MAGLRRALRSRPRINPVLAPSDDMLRVMVYWGVWWVLVLGSVSFWLVRAPLGATYYQNLATIDPQTITGFFAPETTPMGEGVRWTSDHAQVTLPANGTTSHILTFTTEPAATVPPQTRVLVDAAVHQPASFTITRPQRRVYSLVVPPPQPLQTHTTLQLISDHAAPLSSVHGDEHVLGVPLFTLRWYSVAPPIWLLPVQIGSVVVCALLFTVLLRAARVPLWGQVVSIGLLLAIVLAMRQTDPRYIYRLYALGVTSTVSIGLGLAWWLLRRAGVPTVTLRPWRALVQAYWWLPVSYTVITLLLLLPLLPQFTTHILGLPGDAYEYLWKMQWFSDALVRQGTSPTFVPQLYYPGGYELASSELTPAHTLLGVPITALFGAVTSINVWQVVGFVLTALFTALLAQRLGARLLAAWVAGLIVAYCERRFFHVVAGHLPLVGTQWIVLTLYAWEGVLRYGRTFDGFLAGLGLALTTWSSLYYGPTLMLLLALYTPFRVGLRQLPTLVTRWQAVLVAAAVMLTLTVPMLQPYVELRLQGNDYQHSLLLLDIHRVRPYYMLLPNAAHPLWGTWAQQFMHLGGEIYVSIGYTALLLAVFGAVRWRQSRVVRALLAVIVVNLLMVPGPVLELDPTLTFAAPASLVHEYVPILGSLRVWSRMILYVMVGVAVLAALGLSSLRGRWYVVACLLAATFIMAESYRDFPLSQPAPRPVDNWLLQQPHGSVLEIPDSFSGTAEYTTLLHGKPSTVGYGTFFPPAYEAHRPMFGNAPVPAMIPIIAQWQTRYIVVDTNALAARYPTTNWQHAFADDALALRYDDGTHRVYEIRRWATPP